MIEMLGVLAIIGVLSVGGIVGRCNNNDILPMYQTLPLKAVSAVAILANFLLCFHKDKK